MKMNNKIATKVTVILMLLGLIVTFTHCMPENSVQVGNSGSEESHYEVPTPPKNEEQELNETQVTVGIKNHEQILQTMASLTGIDPYLPVYSRVLAVYTQVTLSLPTDNDVKVFSPTHQIAVTKLAAEFCDNLVEGGFNGNTRVLDTALRSAVWPTIEFGSAPSVALTPAKQKIAVSNVIDAFWLDMLEEEELTMAKNDLTLLLNDLIQLETDNRNLTLKAMKGLCTATLSSAHVILL